MNTITLRVYGILINEQQQVLVSDEYIRGAYFTKFPGGGLEYGEGTRDCLKREFLEEMSLRVSVGDHIYTTDFFQASAFRAGQQVVSIYYYVQPLEEIAAPLRQAPFDYDASQLKLYTERQEIESFRFIPWEDFSADILSLPIDKVVAEIIKRNGAPRLPGNA